MPPAAKTAPNPKPPKRSRTSAVPAPNLKNPFYYSIYSTDSDDEPLPDEQVTGVTRQSVLLKLCIPDPSEECPITAQPMADPTATSDLSFIPERNRFFSLDRPDHTKAALPCGHAFSAMHLVYYYAKVSMRCPCCREGWPRRASVQSLPDHFRHDMARKIEASAIQDARQMEEENRQAAIFIGRPIPYEAVLFDPFGDNNNQATGHQLPPISLASAPTMTALRYNYIDLANEGHLTLRVSFYERNATTLALRTNLIIGGALQSNPDEGGAIQREVSQHLAGQNGARRILSLSDNGTEAQPLGIIHSDSAEIFNEIRSRTFTPNQNTLRTMKQLISSGLSMLQFTVLAKIRESPGSRERTLIIESSEKISLPLSGVRDARLIVPGRNQLQSRFVDEIFEISIGEAGLGCLSQFHICFTDEEEPCISGVSWAPNQGHMHWFRFD